jgi:hypothetical protein
MKNRGKQVLGAALVLASVWLSVLILRRLVFTDIWQVGGVLLRLYTLGFLVLNAIFAVWLLYFGMRMVNPKTFRPSRFGWGRIISGATILYMQVGFDSKLVSGGPYKPSTQAQAASVLVIDLVAVYLIFRGIRAGFARPESQPDILPP